MKECFSVRRPAYDEYFLGRHDYIAALKENIQDRPVYFASVFGLAKIGKSSLLAKVMSELEASSQELIRVEVTLGSCSDSLDFWDTLLEEALDELGDDRLLAKYDDLEEENLRARLKLLTKALDLANKQGKKVVLIIDEFDAAMSLFKDEPANFHCLNDLMNSPRRELALLILSRASLKRIELEACGKYINETADQVNITGFNDRDMEAYYKRLEEFEVRLNKTNKKRLIHYCGSFPYFLALLGNKLVEYRKSGPISDQVEPVDRAFKECRQLFRTVYDEIMKNMLEEQLYNKFIQMFIGPKYDMKNADLDALMDYGYVQSKKHQDEEDLPFTSVSDDFIDYFTETCTKPEIEGWLLLGTAEKILRFFLHKGYDNKYASSGDQKLFNKVQDLAKQKKVDPRRLNAFKSNETKYNDHDIAKVLSIKDLNVLYSYDWSDMFMRYFNNDDYSVWEERIDLLHACRNPYAHNATENLTEQQLSLAGTYSELIIEQGKKHNYRS